MAKMMSYQEGKIDSPFSLRCEIQILVQCRSRFYVFYKHINYEFKPLLEASRETISINTEKASS